MMVGKSQDFGSLLIHRKYRQVGMKGFEHEANELISSSAKLD